MRNERLQAGDQATAELVWLLGQPHLGDYLDFVKAKVIGGAAIPPRRLAHEWRAANDYYYRLEQDEPGARKADNGVHRAPPVRTDAFCSPETEERRIDIAPYAA